MLLKIAEVIAAHGAEIAFPTSTVHLPDGVALHSDAGVVDAPVAVMPRPEEADVAQTLPEPVAIPAEPVSLPIVEAIILPDVAARQSEPLPTSEPEMPLLAATDAPTTTAELITIAEPELPVAVVDPVEPLLVVAPPLLEDIVIPDSAASVAKERPEATVVVEEVLSPTEIVPSPESAEIQPASIEPSTEAWSDEEFAAVLGEDLVAAVVAQPNIPQEFRPSGIPVVRPGRVTRRTTIDEDELLVASIPAPLKIVEPPRLPDLLPEPEPEPGVIYVVPFVAIMVPDEVNARIFDQFVDLLIREGAALGLQFVILKEGLQRTSPEWLATRQYVTGEIYAYVEDSGCCSTDLRTKARLTYRHPSQNNPAFGFDYPVKSFFDHDRSTLNVERAKLSDDIAATLAGELLKALQN